MDRNLLRKSVTARDTVALRKESVDRNGGLQAALSGGTVALRKESVDRNPKCSMTGCLNTGRSPQGERG